ncbi:hypothetical protein [Ottowia sp.]|uniref:hypothetical protein n=1 Tax=Ottowia sp. TaxID=1898956 RepID=UPI00262F9A79|nr:hypothetical protein [Ottowia sp.]
MAKKATADTGSYWLPGFEPDLPTSLEPAVASGMIRVVDTLPIQPAPTVVADVETATNETTIAEVVAETIDAVPAQAWRLSAVAGEPAPRVRFPRLQRDALTGLAGTAAKFDANVRAIEILAELESEQRQADASERLALARYTGWGSQPAAFNFEGKELAWTRRAERLQALLDDDDYGFIRK